MKCIIKARTTLAFVAGLLCFSEANAQTFISPGTVELGGSVLVSSQTASNNDKLNTIIFSPFLGMMITSGLEISLIPSYVSLTENDYTSSIMALYVAPTINFSSGGNSYPFLEFLFGYNMHNNGSSTGGVGWGFDTGGKFNVTANGLMLLQLQFLSQNFKSENKNAYTTLNTISLGIGFRVFITKKAEAK
jgi:hypothetical protein